MGIIFIYYHLQINKVLFLSLQPITTIDTPIQLFYLTYHVSCKTHSKTFFYGSGTKCLLRVNDAGWRKYMICLVLVFTCTYNY